ncbi:hypothetical protein BC831DRAFT_272238 [Entophlyctis helioformis]|nr:hypothetical protein BC831DRAFT_272238 [Entophlyctis helioformis]
MQGQAPCQRRRRVAVVGSPHSAAVCDRLPCNPGRSSHVHQLVAAYGLLDLDHVCALDPVPATADDLETFHSPDYVEFLLAVEGMDASDPDVHSQIADYGLQDDCHVFAGLAQYVTTVAGGSMTAARALCAGDADVAVHWDGGRHHALKDTAQGFCHVNDAVLAVLVLRTRFSRVLYIDLDVHHGDGVESAFAASPSVLTLSFHRHELGFFPGTGSLSDIGQGKGTHYALNVPFTQGLAGPLFAATAIPLIRRAIAVFDPLTIVVQCGADGITGDPLGGCNIDLDSYTRVVGDILDAARPTLLLGGGGYVSTTAARLWSACTAVAAGVDLANDLPDHELLAAYGPVYQLRLDPGNMADTNTRNDHLARSVSSVMASLDVIHGQRSRSARSQ